MNQVKKIQQRRFVMALPILVGPFLTMIFWALGGGQGSPAQAKSLEGSGLNLELPNAQFKNQEPWDKLSLYEKAQQENARAREAQQNDPYFDLIPFPTDTNQHRQPKAGSEKSGTLINAFPAKAQQPMDPNEELVNRKLEQLYQEINKPSPNTLESKNHPAPMEPINAPDLQFNADVDRLEKMMELMAPTNQSDPEMQQIESMLEKILDIQHPERVLERRNKQIREEWDSSLPVIPDLQHEGISLLTPDRYKPLDSVYYPRLPLCPPDHGFYRLEDDQPASTEVPNAIQAVIHDTQELVSGATVKMRLIQSIRVNNIHIPADALLYGTGSINGERLIISINSIRVHASVYPVSLSAFDLDGMEGIYVPGALTREAAKQASDGAMQNFQLMSLDPSLPAQAAGAGVEAAKGLLGKKARLTKVTVKAGYKILLVDKKSNP
jgi:conjugative transposon TraM protein